MTCVLFTVIAAAVLVSLHVHMTQCANPPPQVTVRKCCPFNEELRVRDHMDTDSILEAVQCIPSNVTEWVPKIKYKKRPGFFTPDGGKPKFMTFEPNQLPLGACSEPMHTSGPHSAILVTDGSLIVSARNLVIQQNERFCVDRESAIYCLPESTTSTVNSIGDTDQSTAPRADMRGSGGLEPENMAKWQRRRTTVRKCCGQGWAYNARAKTCVHLNNPMNPLNSKPVFDQSILHKTRLDLLNGFPSSCGHANFAILGTFKPEMFDEEQNVLRLENSDRALKEADFCLEHMVTRENDTVYSSFVTVFTCAEFFPASGSQPEQNEIVRVSGGGTGGTRGSRGEEVVKMMEDTNGASPSSSSSSIPLQDYRYVVYAVGLIISLIFLIATLVISFLVPSNHHALHWRCQTYYVACLLVGDFFLAITQLAGDSILEPYCSIVGKWGMMGRCLSGVDEVIEWGSKIFSRCRFLQVICRR